MKYIIVEVKMDPPPEMFYCPLVLDPRSVTVAMFIDRQQVLTWHLAPT